MKPDQKNLILAMVLSALFITGWQYFVVAPRVAAQRAAIAAKALQAKIAKPVLPAGVVAPGSLPRAAALALSPRVTIATPKLGGSIALKGARIDDVILTTYHETVSKESPHITLLRPQASKAAYYADFDVVPPQGANELLPGPDTLWTSSGGDLTPTHPVTLSFDNKAGLIFHRTFAVDANYMFTITDSVTNKGTASASYYPHAALVRVGTPQVDGYATLFEGLLGKIGDNKLTELTYAAIDKDGQRMQDQKGAGGWLGFTDKYWATALIPDQTTDIHGIFQSLGTTQRTYSAETLSKLVTLAPGATSTTTTRLFAGAKVTDLIYGYEKNLNIKNFNLMIDWGWFWFITQPMFRLLDYLGHLTGSFALAILLTTVLLKAAFFPLANKSFASMAKMKNAQPQIKALKERFPDDAAAVQRETMELYKREKINPVAGCLPMVIQIPVFFSLYKVLFTTIEMRHAPFFGWIKDMSVPDPTNIFNLFGLLPIDPTQLPVFGHFLHLGIWPLVMGLTMFLQMKLNPEPDDPVQRQLFTLMPLIFTFTFGGFPAGLVIYYAWNNSLTLIQQSFIMKRAGVKVELWDNLTNMFRRKPSAGTP